MGCIEIRSLTVHADKTTASFMPAMGRMTPWLSTLSHLPAPQSFTPQIAQSTVSPPPLTFANVECACVPKVDVVVRRERDLHQQGQGPNSFWTLQAASVQAKNIYFTAWKVCILSVPRAPLSMCQCSPRPLCTSTHLATQLCITRTHKDICAICIWPRWEAARQAVVVHCQACKPPEIPHADQCWWQVPAARQASKSHDILHNARVHGRWHVPRAGQAASNVVIAQVKPAELGWQLPISRERAIEPAEGRGPERNLYF